METLIQTNVWNQTTPQSNTNAICRMMDGYIKMCHWTGEKWLDMWKDTLEGEVKEWMNIPYTGEINENPKSMKPIGYVIYTIWDFYYGNENDLKKITVQPEPEAKKRIYSDLKSAEDAVEQMRKAHISQNPFYKILPIYTPQIEYRVIREEYVRRRNLNDNKL